METMKLKLDGENGVGRATRLPINLIFYKLGMTIYFFGLFPIS